MNESDANIVVDHGVSSWADLWTKEDYLAIWLGFVIIGVSLIAYFGFGLTAEFGKKIEIANQIQSIEAAKFPFKTTRPNLNQFGKCLNLIFLLPAQIPNNKFWIWSLSLSMSLFGRRFTEKVISIVAPPYS